MKGCSKSLKVDLKSFNLTKDYIRLIRFYSYDNKLIYDVVYHKDISPIKYEGELITNSIRV